MKKVFKICGSNTTSPSSLLFLRWNSFGKTLHSRLKNNGRELQNCMIPLKSSLKRNYRCFQKIIPEQPKGKNSLFWITVLDVSVHSHWPHGFWKPGEAEACNRGYLPITDKKQREKDKSSRQDTIPKNIPSMAHFLYLGLTSWSF